MELTGSPLTYRPTKPLPGVGLEEAVTRVTDALNAERFGVLTEIDLQKTLKKKLGVDFPRDVILGASKAPLTHRALSAVKGFPVDL